MQFKIYLKILKYYLKRLIQRILVIVQTNPNHPIGVQNLAILSDNILLSQNLPLRILLHLQIPSKVRNVPVNLVKLKLTS